MITLDYGGAFFFLVWWSYDVNWRFKEGKQRAEKNNEISVDYIRNPPILSWLLIIIIDLRHVKGRNMKENQIFDQNWREGKRDMQRYNRSTSNLLRGKTASKIIISQIIFLSLCYWPWSAAHWVELGKRTLWTHTLNTHSEHTLWTHTCFFFSSIWEIMFLRPAQIGE